jgi:predicted MFS family arabinose efflux permease
MTHTRIKSGCQLFGRNHARLLRFDHVHARWLTPQPTPIVIQRRASPAIFRLLAVLSLVAFASSLSVRSVDPVIPLVAADLAVSTATAALLSTAFALPYALTQPILGPVADMVGKTRFMTGCLVVLTAACLVGALAPSFAVVLGARVLSGIVAGGVFPIAMAVIGDRVAIAERQVAIGRLLAAAMIGNLLGASLSGVVGDVVGWRGVFVGMGLFALLATIGAVVGFRATGRERPARLDLAAIPANYRIIVTNPRAKICFAAVFLEGVFVFGLFPYVAVLLNAAGETRASIAGLVIAGFGIGGLCYAGAVSLLIARLGGRRMMALGGAFVAAALAFISLDLAWPYQFAAFLVLGFSFFTLHGCIQIYATELAPTARASAMSLHSASFFLGQAAGPLYYGLGLAQGQGTASILFGGLAVLAVGIACARWLPQRGPDSSAS